MHVGRHMSRLFIGLYAHQSSRCGGFATGDECELVKGTHLLVIDLQFVIVDRKPQGQTAISVIKPYF